MIKSLLIFLWLSCLLPVALCAQQADKVDSIEFHLYTDSLKKGVHNYINIDAKMASGRWQPLTAKEVLFSATAGKFDGNSLLIDTGFKGEKITVKAMLKSDTARWKEITIYVKKIETNEKLKTMEEVMKGQQVPRGSRKKRNG